MSSKNTEKVPGQWEYLVTLIFSGGKLCRRVCLVTSTNFDFVYFQGRFKHLQGHLFLIVAKVPPAPAVSWDAHQKSHRGKGLGQFSGIDWFELFDRVTFCYLAIVKTYVDLMQKIFQPTDQINVARAVRVVLLDPCYN